ncbi:hypothetical protein [uncultured Mitsuokella sp.]|uniref:hypothetical protein n=1 Tax=uncultured Mitsuokella sp. TaxID=453120 RepID=UPI002615C21C|nr:hypothetical protein [uncultured Mitsuokella sp.]
MFDVSLFHTFYSQHIFPAGTAAQRKRRQVDRNDRIQFSNNIRAFYAENITGHDVVDDELVGGLRVIDAAKKNLAQLQEKLSTSAVTPHPLRLGI